MEVSTGEPSRILPNEAANVDIPEMHLQIEAGSRIENKDPGCPMPQVPPLLRQAKNNQQDYDPVVVSIGPYHHGKDQFQLVENFKMTALQMFVTHSHKDAQFFYSQVFHRVSDARNCYIKDSTEQYDDATFAQMMLLDASFLVIFMDHENFYPTYLDDLVMAMIFRDIILLENQIPFWLLMLLIRLAYGKEEGEKMLNRFLYHACFGEFKGNGIAWFDKELPHHLLGAHWVILVDESPIDKSTTPESRHSNEFGCLSDLPNFDKCSDLLHKYTCSLPCFPGSRRNDNGQSFKKYVYCFRSAMDLKEKGIHFRPSSADSLKGIKFKSNYFYARLEVPVRFVTIHTKMFFLNLIAYEMCAKTRQDHVLTAYIEFMKSLIDSPKDVKELREKRILLTTLGSDEEVVKVYKEIKTYGVENVIIFHDVREKIQNHYYNKGKTWLAELFYTYFRSPWTAIALIAAAFLLALTCVQTYYTARPS